MGTFITGFVLGGVLVAAGLLYYLNRNPEKLRAWAAKIEGKIREKL